jgi:hypothetical protein
MHLPEDVSIRISDHNGTRLRLLYSLWSDWIEAIGNPDALDEIYDCMLDAADSFQCANFNFLHGYYRGALAELRVALEIVMIGTYGSLNPKNENYLAWKKGAGELSFRRCRKPLSGTLGKGNAKWMFEDDALLNVAYKTLCDYAHSRPGSNYFQLWQSNGPVYNSDAIDLTFEMTLVVIALCYLLVRLARREFTMPENSEMILFELERMPYYGELVRAFKELYGRPPRRPTMV